MADNGSGSDDGHVADISRRRTEDVDHLDRDGMLVPIATSPPANGPGGGQSAVRLRGDELDLYADFHADLLHTVRANVRAAPDVIEDACSFAWVEFLRLQPDRDRNWQGWLFRTAQREAWRLNASDWREREYVDCNGKVQEAPDPADHHEQRLEFHAALEELRKLPPRLQQVVLVNSQVHKQADVAEILGVSRPRVAQLLVEAALKVAALNEERHAAERPVAVPRAARLRELEQDPPSWLAAAIGTLPERSKSSASVVLAWRRAALAIDDCRRVACHHDPYVSIGPRPIEPAAKRAWLRAERAISDVAQERERRSRGRSR